MMKEMKREFEEGDLVSACAGSDMK